MEQFKQIALWILEQGKSITKDVLEEKLIEAYEAGKRDSSLIYQTLDDIRYNTLSKIKKEKQELFEKNFYNKPSDEDANKMRALEYVEKNIGDIITMYQNN